MDLGFLIGRISAKILLVAVSFMSVFFRLAPIQS